MHKLPAIPANPHVFLASVAAVKREGDGKVQGIHTPLLVVVGGKDRAAYRTVEAVGMEWGKGQYPESEGWLNHSVAVKEYSKVVMLTWEGGADGRLSEIDRQDGVDNDNSCCVDLDPGSGDL